MTQMTQQEKYAILTDPRYPRAAKYDPQWFLDNAMGSPCLQLADSLSQAMDLRPGMRVLDLGCGAALHSIFLAKEFGVQVWAADLWISPSDNWRRIQAAGMENLVLPLHAEAHALPFSQGYFDAVISINSFQFFATANTYLADHLAPLLREGGQLGVMVFGPREEFGGPVPDYLQPGWWPDFYYFHSPAWWRWHLEQTRLFDSVSIDDLDGDGNRLAILWETVMDKISILRDDQAKTLGWWRMVARRNQFMPDDFRITKG